MRSKRTMVVGVLLLASTGCGESPKGESPKGESPDASKSDGGGQADASNGDASSGSSGDLDATPQGRESDGGDPETSADAGPIEGSVAMFVAQGHRGRIAISCDDGKSWREVQETQTEHCWEDPLQLNCDHESFAGRGLAYGNGVVLATFGWGKPGYIARSTDGVSWDDKLPQTSMFADLAFGSGEFVANSFTPTYSSDGKDWSEGGKSVLTVGSPRAIGFTPKNGGRFVVSGEQDADHDVVISEDNGLSWKHPATLPSACGAGVTGIASSPDVVIIAQGNGTICSSSDGGDNWKTSSVGGGLSSPPVWTGSEFMVWRSGEVLRSADGETWGAPQAISIPSVKLGAVAVNAKGTFVAVDGEWGHWYAAQAFYRSTDGVNWKALPSTAFVGGHPINFIEAVQVKASELCPGT